MKKLIIVLIFFCAVLPHKQVKAQTISTMFNAGNYWRPNRSPFAGQLQNFWSEIEASGIKYMRVGGKSYDGNGTHVWTDIELATTTTGIIDEIRLRHIEPILQVPIDKNASIATNCTTAVNLLTAINSTYNKNIIYWEICNEPDGSYGPNFDDASEIQPLIQQVSAAMKGVTGQSGIKIIGPSLSSFNPASNNTMMDDLVGGSADITGAISPGLYYVDFISFNIYPFRSEVYWQTGSSGSPIPRSDVVSNLTSTDRLQEDLIHLNSRISTAGRTGTMDIAITEANISYEQNTSDKGADGLGPGSFIGGQFWAEMMCIAMDEGVKCLAFWSAIEGSSATTPQYITDIGYIGRESLTERSTYWHYQLVAKNFAGTYLPNSYANSANYKGFAYNNSATNEIGVLIMNQLMGSNPTRATDTHTKSFKINFNSATPTGIYDMKFSFAGGGIPDHECNITVETTMLLVFDATTGALKRKQTYSLRDALRTTDTGTITNITNAASDYLYDNYTDPAPLHSDITIGTGALITAGNNKVFTATNSITLNGPFSSNGKTLSLSTSPTTCYSNP